VLEYPIAGEDAIVGARVRDLGLPRDAVVNVIVRDDQAIPPRGSTRLRAGDRLHVLLRHEAAAHTRDLMGRWRSGPIGRAPRPPRVPRGHAAIFTATPWRESDGDPARPVRVRGERVVDQLRMRRDSAGGLFALEDGRYAVTGRVLAVGSRGDVTGWARRRMATADADERAWLHTVIGALALDLHE
jgi:cell volume regulation protein A